MKVRVEITAEAESQFTDLHAWWQANRTASSGQVATELERLRLLIAEQPEIGTRYGRGYTRWLQLKGTPYKLYYRYEPGSDVAMVQSFWSGMRGSGPRLKK